MDDKINFEQYKALCSDEELVEILLLINSLKSKIKSNGLNTSIEKDEDEDEVLFEDIINYTRNNNTTIFSVNLDEIYNTANFEVSFITNLYLYLNDNDFSFILDDEFMKKLKQMEDSDIASLEVDDKTKKAISSLVSSDSDDSAGHKELIYGIFLKEMGQEIDLLKKDSNPEYFIYKLLDNYKDWGEILIKEIDMIIEKNSNKDSKIFSHMYPFVKVFMTMIKSSTIKEEDLIIIEEKIPKVFDIILNSEIESTTKLLDGHYSLLTDTDECKFDCEFYINDLFKTIKRTEDNKYNKKNYDIEALNLNLNDKIKDRAIKSIEKIIELLDYGTLRNDFIIIEHKDRAYISGVNLENVDEWKITIQKNAKKYNVDDSLINEFGMKLENSLKKQKEISLNSNLPWFYDIGIPVLKKEKSINEFEKYKDFLIRLANHQIKIYSEEKYSNFLKEINDISLS